MDTDLFARLTLPKSAPPAGRTLAANEGVNDRQIGRIFWLQGGDDPFGSAEPRFTYSEERNFLIDITAATNVNPAMGAASISRIIESLFKKKGTSISSSASLYTMGSDRALASKLTEREVLQQVPDKSHWEWMNSELNKFLESQAYPVPSP